MHKLIALVCCYLVLAFCVVSGAVLYQVVAMNSATPPSNHVTDSGYNYDSGYRSNVPAYVPQYTETESPNLVYDKPVTLEQPAQRRTPFQFASYQRSDNSDYKYDWKLTGKLVLDQDYVWSKSPRVPNQYAFYRYPNSDGSGEVPVQGANGNQFSYASYSYDSNGNPVYYNNGCSSGNSYGNGDRLGSFGDGGWFPGRGYLRAGRLVARAWVNRPGLFWWRWRAGL